MGETESLEFDAWLKDLLINLNSDDEVFCPYIKSILDTDDSDDDKKESLEGILSSITEEGIEQLCSNILSKWASSVSTLAAISAQAAGNVPSTSANGATKSVDDKLVELMGKQSLKLAATTKPVSKETIELKKAILAQYAEVSGDEEEEDPTEGGATGGGGAVGGGAIAKNSNAATVEQEVKMKRELSKQEHKEKKDKDKEERAKQKAKQDERKEKEKKRTQKGERRR